MHWSLTQVENENEQANDFVDVEQTWQQSHKHSFLPSLLFFTAN